MKTFLYPEPKKWNKLMRRPVADLQQLEKPVKKIIEQVKEKGDKAVRRFTRAFDGVRTKELEVSALAISAASSALSEELKHSILSIFADPVILSKNGLGHSMGTSLARPAAPGGALPIFTRLFSNCTRSAARSLSTCG